MNGRVDEGRAGVCRDEPGTSPRHGDGPYERAAKADVMIARLSTALRAAEGMTRLKLNQLETADGAPGGLCDDIERLLARADELYILRARVMDRRP